LDTKFIFIDDIGWSAEEAQFIDVYNSPIKNIFKLYPYEWLVNEDFGKNILADKNQSYWIEPSWKMLLSNKAILPVLWSLNHSDENLLPSYFEDEKYKLGYNYLKKPLLSREGANISIVKDNTVVSETEGDYGEEGFIYQEICELPEFDNNYAVIGSWVVGQEAAGMGIRESDVLITDNISRFVPHLIS
jgi:glutathionylspermidine synthase